MKTILENLTRKFIHGIKEDKPIVIKPSLLAYIENAIQIVNALKPHSSRELKYVEMIKHYLREIRNGVKKIEKEKQELEEQIRKLEEKKKIKRK